MIIITEVRPRPPRPARSVAGALPGLADTPDETETDAEGQVIDGWDGWSDGPITPASDSWTELPRVSTTTIEETIIKEAIFIGRARLNEDNNIKKLKAAVLTPMGIPRPSNTELILLTFNKSSGVLPLSIPSILGDSFSPDSVNWDNPSKNDGPLRPNLQESLHSYQGSITPTDINGTRTQVHPSIGIGRGLTQNRQRV